MAVNGAHAGTQKRPQLGARKNVQNDFALELIAVGFFPSLPQSDGVLLTLPELFLRHRPGQHAP